MRKWSWTYCGCFCGRERELAHNCGKLLAEIGSETHYRIGLQQETSFFFILKYVHSSLVRPHPSQAQHSLLPFSVQGRFFTRRVYFHLPPASTQALPCPFKGRALPPRQIYHGLCAQDGIWPRAMLTEACGSTKVQGNPKDTA